MLGVLTGFAGIGVIILAGYLFGRFGLLAAGAEHTLSRLAFFLLLPALLFTVLGEADLSRLFAEYVPIAAVAAGVNVLVAVVVSLVLWRRPVADTTVTALASAYVNATNLGIPLSGYVLGDAAASAPVILLQLIVIAPLSLAVLDIATSGRVSVGRLLLQPLRNPVLIASVLGVLVAATGVRIPEPVLAPIELIGAAAIPVVLFAFGLSLHEGGRPLAPGAHRRAVVLALVLKLVLMPVTAWLVARFAFGLEGHALLVAVVLAALPSGQQVYLFARRYARSVGVARDAVLVSTVLAVPVITVVAALLA